MRGRGGEGQTDGATDRQRQINHGQYVRRVSTSIVQPMCAVGYQRTTSRSTEQSVVFFSLRMFALGECLFVGWLRSVPATCEYISGTDLLRKVYVLAH